MGNLIKIYHYCYWVTIVDGAQAGTRIEKECFYGFLDEETLEINSPVHLNLDYNDCALYTSFDIDEDCLCIDFYTVDEINGYEQFINYALRVLSNRAVNSYFEDKRGGNNELQNRR